MVRKLGYENYNDFKLHIVSDLKSLNNEDLSVSNEDMLSLMNKISTISAKSIQQFKDTMPVERLNKVVEMLKSTKYIDIIANDFNQSLAEYASHFLCALGKIVNVYDENNRILTAQGTEYDYLYFGDNKDKEILADVNNFTTIYSLSLIHI